MDKKTIGRRIKDRRLALNMTQSDIANAVGVAISTVQRYEAGTIERIGRARLQPLIYKATRHFPLPFYGV